MRFVNTILNSVLAAATAGGLMLGAGAAKAADIVDIAASDGRFETLVAAVEAAGLVGTLKGRGPFTVFAPTDDAFAALPPGTLDELLEPANKDQLTNILIYHVDDRFLPSRDLPHRRIPIRPIKDEDVLCIQNRRGRVTIEDSTGERATVIIADIQADNGVIHVIDKVLIPGRKSCGH